ncbi:MAG: hypothetical protein FJ090_21395 [Deltaproteobacteria bacterium]|nr:hypothetical protein [Deltaproteobacteria bacterium]
MSPWAQLREQGPGISAMLGLAMSSKGRTLPELPGPVMQREVPARPSGLVAGYLDVVFGG